MFFPKTICLILGIFFYIALASTFCGLTIWYIVKGEYIEALSILLPFVAQVAIMLGFLVGVFHKSCCKCCYKPHDHDHDIVGPTGINCP